MLRCCFADIFAAADSCRCRRRAFLPMPFFDYLMPRHTRAFFRRYFAEPHIILRRVVDCARRRHAFDDA